MIELICTVRTPAAAKDAIYTGVDSICLSLPTDTNQNGFLENCLWSSDVDASVRLAHDAGAKVYIAIASYAPSGVSESWKESLARAETAAVDAVILTEIPLLDYAKANHPGLRLHTAMPIAAATPQVVSFYATLYGVRRVALPIFDLGSFREIFSEHLPIEIEALAINHCWTTSRLPMVRSSKIDVGDRAARIPVALRSPFDCDPPRLGAHPQPLRTGPLKPVTLWQQRQSNPERSISDRARLLLSPRKLASQLHRARTTSLNIEYGEGSKEMMKRAITALRRAIDGKVTTH